MIRSVAFILCLMIFLPVTLVQGADVELIYRYFDSLRSRGLYAVAEEYAATRLADRGLTSGERTRFSIELARTLVDHGILKGSQEREELWKEAQRQLQPVPGTELTAEDRLRLEVWRGMLAAIEGNSISFQAVLQPEMEALRTQAADRLRPAIRDLKGLDDRLGGTRQIQGGLPAAQQLLLRQQAAMLRGESLLWLAQLTTAGVERTSLLLDAERAFETAGAGRHTAKWGREVDVMHARTARLQGDEKRAEKFLEKADAGGPDPSDRDHVLAERVRLELARKRIDVALQLVVDRIRIPSPPADEFRAAAVESLLQAANLAAEKGDAATQQQILTEAENQARKTFGTWRLQTAILLERQQQDRDLGPELARIVRDALAAWQSQKIDLAIQRYGDAAALAFRTQHLDQAFEYALTRASILLQEKRWSEAESALGEINKSFPDHSRAAEADLLRCYAIGQNEPHGTKFQQALRDHVERFPKSPTCGDAFWMLGVEAEHQRKIAEAIELYRQLPVGTPLKDEADLRIVALLEQLIQKQEISLEERLRIDEVASAEIRRIVPPLLSPARQISSVQCRILLQCVKVCLQCRTPLLSEADQILATVRRRIDDEKQISNPQQLGLNPEWIALEQNAVQLRIISLASQKKFPEARQILQELGKTDPAALLSILASLTDLTAKIDVGNQQELGALQRMTVEEIASQRSEMAPEQKLLLDRAAIQASVALQDWPGAIRTIEDVLAVQPNDRALMRQLIDASLKRGTPVDLHRAKDQWVRLEQLEHKGTPPWIEARINIAELLTSLGDTAGAKKLLGVTRTLYPQLGSPELKRRGDELWERLKQ